VTQKRELYWRLALAIVSVAALCLAALESRAQAAPHAMAETVKDELVDVIGRRAEIEADGGPEQYYEAIRAVFAPVIDYELVGSLVLGDFNDQATEEQRRQFADKLETGLMRSVTAYTRSLAQSGDYQFKVLPPAEPVGERDRVMVDLEARSGDAVSQLRFALMRTAADEWKLINLILNQANMGALLRAQFAAAMAKNQNNIEQVIAEWGN